MTIEEIEQSLKTVADNQAQLAETQTGQASRIERLEDSFKESFQRVALAIEQLTELVTIIDERLDAGDQAQAHTDARLDGVIDAQIGFDERFAQFVEVQAEYRRQAEERGARLDAKLAQLVEAQARTEERINRLLSKNGQQP